MIRIIWSTWRRLSVTNYCNQTIDRPQKPTNSRKKNYTTTTTITITGTTIDIYTRKTWAYAPYTRCILTTPTKHALQLHQRKREKKINDANCTYWPVHSKVKTNFFVHCSRVFCVSFSALSNSSSSGVNATVNRHSKFHNLALIRRQQTVDSVNNNEKQGNNAIIAHNKISNCVDFFSSVPESNGLFWLQKRIKDITRYFRLGNCKMGHIKNVNICSGHRELKHHKQNEKFCHWFNNYLDLIFQCTLAIVKPNRTNT